MASQHYDECIAHGINLYWTTLARARGMSLVEIDYASYVISEDRKGPERIIKLRLPETNINESLNKIITYIKAGKMPDSFLFIHNPASENLAYLLEERGFDIDTQGACMVMELNHADLTSSLPEDVRLIEVKENSQLRHWVNIVNTALFGCEIMSYEQFEDIFCLDNTRFYIGLYQELPVSSCMTIYAEDTATLEMVATYAEYRGRGLATGLIKKALSDLQRLGIQTVSLRGEPDAVSIYRKIGFVNHCRRITASCNWDLIVKKTCPGRMDSEIEG